MNSRPEGDGKATADESGLVPLYRFWQPKYWGLWLAVLLLRIITLLPFRWQMRIGQTLGRMAMPLVPKRCRVARVNLRLCFPTLDDARASFREKLLLGEDFEFDEVYPLVPGGDSEK